jgi:hypothetical protein
MLMCPGCKTGRLSDDGHDGNVLVKAPDGRLGIWYKTFFEGNWSPTPPGCYSCGSFFTLPDLIQVPFGARQWINDKGETSDESLRTPTGGYYTRRTFVVDVEARK